MDNNKELIIDAEYSPVLLENDCKELKPIVEDFVKYYVANKDKPTEEWLKNKLKEQLPNKSEKEIQDITNEIVNTLKVDEEKKASLEKAVANGRSKESWFASEVNKATSAMSAQEASKYLAGLDNALQQANESLYHTITTKAGVVSQNPHLDGFIAENYHAQTFNLNAEAAGSPYRAKVLEPVEGSYTKNSVDIVIVDGNGKVVRRYQSKYCKDSATTEQAFENGDYRGQRKLIPEDQKISKDAVDHIEAPDGVKSKPLSKPDAKKLQEEAQSGKWNDLNWNEYKTKDLAIGIGKQAGYAALQGAAIGAGMDIVQKLYNGEEINGEKVVEVALKSGADFGVKAAAAGALKVGVEKGVIGMIPKGTPAGTLANIAFVGIEDMKILGKMVTGELGFKEGIEKIEQTTVACAAGLCTMGKGAAIGAAALSCFGPVGVAVGGFIGGTVGYIAGSKIGETVVKGAQKLRDVAVKTVKTIASGAVSAAKSIVSGVGSAIGSFCRGIGSLFSW